MFRYNDNMAKHTLERAFEIICKSCAKPFITGSSIKHHCSPECRVKDAARLVADKDSCWEWQGSINPKSGYGQLSSWENGKRILLTAHRVSFRAFNGPIPSGLCVCHTCDNRKCFNPHHLFLGSVKDNSVDMVKKGRWYGGERTVHWTSTSPEKIPLGEKHHAAKLTESDVRYIRESSETLQALSEKFAVSKTTLSLIKRMKIWKHVLNPLGD